MELFSRHISLIAVTLFIWTGAVAYAAHQRYTTLTLGIADGLSSTITFDAKLIDEEFLWISTDQGIDRFDGRNFKHYNLNTSPSGIKQMNDGNQYHLTLEGQNQLACYTDKGKVLRYNPDTDQFDVLYDASDILGTHSLHTACLSAGHLLLGVYNGIYVVDLQSKDIIAHLAPDVNVHCIEPFTPGTFLIGSDHGVDCLDLAQRTTHRIASLNAVVRSLYYDHELHKIWIGTHGSGLWAFHQDTGEITLIQHWEHSIINHIIPYANSQLIVGTDGDGILQTSRLYNSPLLQIANDQPTSPYILPVAGIQGLLVDGLNIWICAWGGGISLLRADSFISRVELPHPQALSEKRANDISIDHEGNIWVAFNRAIVRFDHETREPEVFLTTSQATLLAVLCAQDGTIWCGGYNTGLYHLDPKSRKIFHLPSVTEGSTNNSVYTLREDHKGRIWAGGVGMPLSRITPTGRLNVGKEDIVTYGGQTINDIIQLNDTALAIATSNGMTVMHLDTGKEQTVFSDSDTIQWKGTAHMMGLGKDAADNIYLATDGSGLIIYNLKSRTFVNYNSTHGLPSNYLRSIEIQSDSLLWISTSGHGLFSFNPYSGRVIEQYNRNNGLASEEFYRHASTSDLHGNIFFGGRESVEILPAHTPPIKEDGRRILLSGIGLGQEEDLNPKTHPHIINQSLSKVKTIRLPYGEKSLKLSFSVNDLYHQADYRFQYMLDDTEHLWQTLDAQRTLTFYTLPPGKHHLTIRCMNGYGIVAEKTLIIEALQTPWLQWPAILCYILLLLLPVAVAIVAYMKHLSSAAAEEKISFFNNVVHDIRTPLSLVSTPLADLEQYISPDAPHTLLPLIKRNIQHLTDVVSQLALFNSDQQGVQHMKLEPILLNDLAGYLAEAYRPVIEHKGLTLNLILPKEGVWVKADIKALMRICDNLLGNSIKFTKNGSISICVKQSIKYGELEVSDTGIGMSDDVKKRLFKHFFRGQNAIDSLIPGFGLGLMYSYQICQRMHGTMTCQSTEGAGSTLTVLLPLSEAGETRQYDLSCSAQYLPTEETEGKALYSNLRYDILLVEDNPDLLDYLREKLNRGYNVNCAQCVDEAKKIMKDHPIDLIISDIMMPGMRGDEWCQELKADIETSHIPVILLTASSDPKQELHGLSIGADDYITKPFNTNILLAKVCNIFDARRKMHAHYLRVLKKEPPKISRQDEQSVHNQAKASNNLDEEFIQRLMKVIDKYIAQTDLSVNELAREMAMSHTLFYEKVNKLIGMPPASLIRSCRMQHAKALLLEHKYSVSEVALQCGFADAKNFSTAFKKYYGVSPSKIE